MCLYLVEKQGKERSFLSVFHLLFFRIEPYMSSFATETQERLGLFVVCDVATALRKLSYRSLPLHALKRQML